MKLFHYRKVTRDEFGDDWPLTVDEATLRRCPKTGALRLQVRWREVYALNGMAKMAYGDPSIEPIHAASYTDEDGTVLVRKSLRPLIEAAEKIGEEAKR